MKNRMPIIAAVVLAFVAVLAINSYVKSVRQEAEAQLKGKKVVTAAVSIKEGTELTTVLLDTKEVPPQFIPAQAIIGSKKQVSQILGRKTRFPIKAGQILLWSDLEIERRGGLAMVVPEDERAFTIEVSKGVKSGLLHPNDHIDIVASFAVPETKQPGKARSATWQKKSDMVNVVLLQNVTILAVGETLGGVPLGTRSIGGDLTVSVTLPEAQLLMFASQHGELGIALRKEGDIDTVPRAQLPRVTFRELEKLIGTLDQKRKQRIVRIMKGKEVEEVIVDEE